MVSTLAVILIVALLEGIMFCWLLRILVMSESMIW